MQIILLSGGSGKRLWPLSNEARSKQFLPLLASPSGGKESMVQRVVRQLGEAGIDAELTVATNAAQRDIIINQLGDRVGIVAEPERRDTFPAIALSCTWLSLGKSCPADEVVVVMPCDPYTESGYFSTIARMADCVREGAAELVLMGIKPANPSTRYGYVVPEPADAGCPWHRVSRFTEKPDAATAVRLLEEGAWWNGGVFAFRLGYLTDIVSRYVAAETFEELRGRYPELPKISFDYEVVEKAESVAVVAYEGKWKDLGTWNALCEELPEPVTGNGLLGPGARGTSIVNELSVPIFCEGIEGAIVAASPDGILVSAKKTSENIKSYVEHLVDRPMYEERRWGTYRVLDRTKGPDGVESLTKNLFLKAGCNISYQRHNFREEVWTFVSGRGSVRLEGGEKEVRAGDVVHIRRGELHGLKALTPLNLIEVQIGTRLVEEDIERLELTW